MRGRQGRGGWGFQSRADAAGAAADSCAHRAPRPQSRGADPSLRTEDYDPYLNPGRKLPVEVALEDEAMRARLLALEKKYSHVPKVRRLACQRQRSARARDGGSGMLRRQA